MKINQGGNGLALQIEDRGALKSRMLELMVIDGALLLHSPEKSCARKILKTANFPSSQGCVFIMILCH